MDPRLEIGADRHGTSDEPSNGKEDRMDLIIGLLILAAVFFLFFIALLFIAMNREK